VEVQLVELTGIIYSKAKQMVRAKAITELEGIEEWIYLFRFCCSKEFYYIKRNIHKALLGYIYYTSFRLSV